MNTAAGEQWSVGQLLKWTSNYFSDKGLSDPLLSAQLLLARVLGCSKVDLYLRFEQSVSPEARTAYRELVKRAASGEPIAYLIGTKEFYSLEFEVNRAVLIPRPETEILVQWVVRKVRSDEALGSRDELAILELGAGSGCISVSLARNLPKPGQFVATDVSAEALAVAKRNAERHGVADRIQFVESNLYERIEPTGQFDLVVGNLPYVTEADYERLPRHIKDFEAVGALVAGPEGLDAIEPAIAEGWKYLRERGFLVLEIGYNQSEKVREIFGRHPYDEVIFEKDHAEIRRVAIGFTQGK